MAEKLVSDLLKLSPDLAKVVAHYAQPKAACLIQGNVYSIVLDNVCKYKFHLPILYHCEMYLLKEFIPPIDDFLIPENGDVSVQIGRIEDDYLVVRRKDEYIDLVFGHGYLTHECTLEVDIYYEAVCTMLRDAKEKIRKTITDLH